MKKCFRVIYRYSQEEMELISLINVYFAVSNGVDKRGRHHGLSQADYKKALKDADQLGGINTIFQKIKALGRKLGWLLITDQHLENLVYNLEKRDWTKDFTECGLYNNIAEAQRAANQHKCEYKIESYIIC